MNHFLVVLSAFLVVEAMAVEIIAHRGYSCGSSDNTVDAVKLAWAVEADGVEVDLRTTNDGVIVLYHDEKFNGRFLSEQNYEDIHRESNGTIPTLEQVLAIGNSPGYFVLDLKSDDSSDYDSLPMLIEASGKGQHQIIVQGPSIPVLRNVSAGLPGAAYYYLSDLKRKLPFFSKPKPTSILKEINGLRAMGVSLKGRRFLTPEFFNVFKEAGYRVHVWTVNDSARAMEYVAMGADGIITDAVERIQSELEGKNEDENLCSQMLQATRK